MTNIYILTQALEVLETFYALHVLVYIYSLQAFYALHILVYIDSLHALELFVYINLPLLMRSRFSMYFRRLFKSALYHVFM